MSSPGLVTSCFRGLFRLLVPAPSPGTYELIDHGGRKNREEASGLIEVTSVQDGWVRYELLPLGSFAPRSMEVAAFNLSYRRVRKA